MKGLSIKDAQALGFKFVGMPVQAPKPLKAPTARTEAAKVASGLFLASCARWGLPTPVPEYKFCPERRWRADWCFADWLLLEIEGGAWTNGAHVRGKHFLSDMEKYNEATLMGFVVLRVTPQMVNDGSAFALVARALGKTPETVLTAPPAVDNVSGTPLAL